MIRRVLQMLSLVALVLGGPAQGLFIPAPPASACCCCGTDDPGPEPGPCGMPKGPCAPRCPQAPASQTLRAPVALAAPAQAAQRRRLIRTPEPAPWPAEVAWFQASAPLAPSAPAHGPPSPPDLQAKLCQFRI